MISYWARRVGNGIRKVSAGLRPFSESVWPGVRNDLFVAHESIYHFGSAYCSERRVLDAGCGTGYGTFRLANSSADSALGIDLDSRSVSYARRHFTARGLSFAVADLEELPFPDQSFDTVLASNSLEHLHKPGRFLGRLTKVLATSGVAIIALPPILGDKERALHAGIHYHRSNLAVDEWLELFAGAGFTIDCYSHRVASPEVTPDVYSPARSHLTVEDFAFVPSDRDRLYSEFSITAVSVLRHAA